MIYKDETYLCCFNSYRSDRQTQEISGRSGPGKTFCADNGHGYVFAEAGVETTQTQAKTLDELVHGLREAKAVI